MSEPGQHELANRLLEQCVVVLVKTTHSGNIGAVARACKTMGIKRLRLAAPVAEVDHEAQRRASGADDVLAGAGIYDSLEAAIADCHSVVGASARSRSFVWPVASPREVAEGIFSAAAGREAAPHGALTALVFGQEASGLSNEELHLCNRHVCIPANPEYSSLNLAMAVQVIAYECRMAALAQAGTKVVDDSSLAVLGPDADGWDEPAATVGEVEGMLSHLEQALTQLGYHDPSNPRMLMPRMRRLFARSKLDRMEVNIFRGISKFILKATSAAGVSPASVSGPKDE